MKKFRSKYCIGQSVHHRLFGYYGVIMGVDPEFRHTEEWYEMMARSRPPKDEPWYHIQVQGGGTRYVAERNLELYSAAWN